MAVEWRRTFGTDTCRIMPDFYDTSYVPMSAEQRKAIQTELGSKPLPPRPTFVRLTHPTTGKFVGEYDYTREILMVVDRGGTAWFDMARIKADATETVEG